MRMKHFTTLSREQLQEYAAVSANNRRTPLLRWAYAHADQLRAEYEKGVRVKEIAKKYQITERGAYRIVRGK